MGKPGFNSSSNFSLINEVEEFNFLKQKQFKPVSQCLEFFRASYASIATALGVFLINSFSMVAANSTENNKIVAGYAVGFTCYMCLQVAVVMSINDGLFTQLSQAFGAKNFRYMGILLQRGFWINVLYIIITFPIVLQLQQIMMFFNVEEATAKNAQIFVLYSLPGVICYIGGEVIKQLFMASREFHIPMYIQNFSYGLSAIFLYIFVVNMQWGVPGIAIARSCSEFLGFALMYIFLKKDIRDKQEESLFFESWIPLSMEALRLQEIWDFLVKSFTIGACVYLENIFFEIQMLMVATYGNEEQLAAHASFCQLLLFFYMIPFGMGLSANTFMGNLMGAGKDQVAQNFSKIIVSATITFVVAFQILGWILKNFFTRYFTTEGDMRMYFEQIYELYLIMYFIPDSFQVIISSVLRSLGQQDYAMYVFFGAYYLIGTPLGYFMIFTMDLGTYGAWINFGIVSWITCILYLYKLKQVNVKKASTKIRQQIMEECIQGDIELTMEKALSEKLMDGQQDVSPLKAQELQIIVPNKLQKY